MTATRYGQILSAGSSLQLPYHFYSEYAPGEHGLTVYVDLLSEVWLWKEQQRERESKCIYRILLLVLLDIMVQSPSLIQKAHGSIFNCK